MRLDRFICRSTELTKGEATTVIQSGQVFVNDAAIIDPSVQVHENNQIRLNDKTLTPREPRYLLMHKPINTICSNIDEAYPSLFNCIEIEKASELHIAGRLDADTTGLVLITDDGRWSYNITHPQHLCKKVYRVTLRAPLTEEARTLLTQGILLQGEDTPTRPAKIELVSGAKSVENSQVLLTITEGRYHQVKRMFAAVGNKVVGLHREQIGEIRLDVEESQWRFLTAEEVKSFTD